MRSMLLRSFGLLLAFAVATISATAQNYSATSAVENKPPPLSGKRFIGEKLTFEGKVSRLRISMAIADLVFTAAAGKNENELSIKTVATSKGTMLKLFRYSFLQEYESTVDLNTFRILTTTKHDVQKQRVRDSEAIFDYDAKRVTYVETDPKDSTRPPRRIASEITDTVNDMVSVIYALRMQEMAVGKRFEFAVSDSGLVYKVPVSIVKREQVSTPLGKLWCYRVEPDIFGPGRLIERKGKMVLWITEDARKLPVRSQVDTEYGKVDIRLKSAAGPT